MTLKLTALATGVQLLTAAIQNSLANNATAWSSVLSNDAAGERDLSALYRYKLNAQQSNRAANAAIDLLVVPHTGLAPTQNDPIIDSYVIHTWDVDDGFSFGMILYIPAHTRLLLPPSDYQVGIRNRTGALFNASHTGDDYLYEYRYGYEDV